MNILLVYPRFSETFWSFRHLLQFIGKKAVFPPLGLITVAAMLPPLWEKKLVDLNICDKLADKDIKWADYVFIGVMTPQSDSAEKVVQRCNEIGTPVVIGGPILEAGCDKFPTADHILIGEAEETIPRFLDDLENNKKQRVYRPQKFTDILTSPIPLWGLIDRKAYASTLVQYGRGCPFNCTFCNVAAISGRRMRTKSPQQFIAEIDELYNSGIRGGIMVADDNLIGNKVEVKKMLPMLIEWQEGHNFPFEFTAEVDVTLAGDEYLMKTMARAGFRKLFLGLETPNRSSLIECNKLQNTRIDMAVCVKILQEHGFIPMSGFIVGFDADDPENFATQMIDFIQSTGIVIAMVGVLKAWEGTSLYKKLHDEGRIIPMAWSNNTDCYPNFIPKMPVETLVQGYKKIWDIYTPRKYYETICVFLRAHKGERVTKMRLSKEDIRAFLMSVLYIGLLGGIKTSYYYWKTLWFACRHNLQLFPEAVAFQIRGWHFRKLRAIIQES